MATKLYKSGGRSLFTETITTIRDVWVEPPIDHVTPPITPPINTLTPEPPDTTTVSPIIGQQLIPCITATGKQGFRVVQLYEDGTSVPLGPCLAGIDVSF